MEKIEIRKMEIKDFEKVHELVNQIYKLHLNNRKDIYRNEDPLYRKNFIDFLNNPKCMCYVAAVNNEIVGEIIATIKEIKEEGIFKYRKILYIEDICVDSKHSKRGIGTRLYEMVKEKALCDDIDSIELNVWAFNEGAIKFYEKLGLKCKSMRFESKLK